MRQPASPIGGGLLRTWAGFVGTGQSKIADLVGANLVNVSVTAAAVLLLASSWLPLLLVGSAVGMVTVVLLVLLLRRELGRGVSVLGAYSGPRLILLVAVAGGFSASRPDEAAWVWVATGLGLLAVLSEGSLALVLKRTEPVAVQLPGVRAVPDPPFPPDRLVVLTIVEVMVGGALAALGAPGWTYLGLAVVGFAATALIFAYAAQANVVARRAAVGITAALEDHAPAFAAYYDGFRGAAYQLGMWLPYLERLDQPFIVITRDPRTVPTIARLTSAPIIVPKDNSEYANLDHIVVGSLHAAFYVAASATNLTFQRYRRLTHVWLGHGDSDKEASYSTRHASYDKLFVSGPQAIERYAAHGAAVPARKFVVVGRPHVERIDVRDEPPPTGTRRTVLYAPTWRGSRATINHSSLPLAEQIVSALLERGVTVVFRSHPMSRNDSVDAARIHQVERLLESDRRATGRAHVWGARAEKDWDVAACANASDALVTDVSSVASDYLASGKPMAMVAVRKRGDAFRAEFAMARVAYVIEKDLSTLSGALVSLLGDDPLAEARRAYRADCLGGHVGPGAATEFLRAAGEIVGGKS